MPKLVQTITDAYISSIAQESDYVNSKFSISEENSSENTGSTEDTESADVSEINAESDMTDAAYEEVVADAMETILSDGSVLEELATYDQTLWEKVKAWINEVISRIKAHYKNLNPNSQAAKVLADSMDSLTELQEMFATAARKAGERTKAASQGDVTRMNEENMHVSGEKMSVSKTKRYTYDSLIKNDDLTVIELPNSVPLESDGKTMDREAVTEAARKNARSKNNDKNTQFATYVYVPSIGENVLVGKKGLLHGLSHGAVDTGLSTMKIGDLLSNSVAINELEGRTSNKKTTDISYVLLSVGKNNTDSFVSRIVVDKTTSEVTEISTFGLYSVRTKKGELFSPVGDEADASKSSSPYLLSKISIADLLEKVKGIPIINEVFSKDVAQKLNVLRSKGDLSPMLRYSIEASDTECSNTAPAKKQPRQIGGAQIADKPYS